MANIASRTVALPTSGMTYRSKSKVA